MKKSRRTYNGVHLNKKSNTQDVVEQSLTLYQPWCEFTAEHKQTAYFIAFILLQVSSVLHTLRIDSFSSLNQLIFNSKSHFALCFSKESYFERLPT